VVSQKRVGNFRPATDRSSEKIDGAVALAMAVGRVMARPVEVEVEWEVRIV
jgi:hypothetical protein